MSGNGTPAAPLGVDPVDVFWPNQRITTEASTITMECGPHRWLKVEDAACNNGGRSSFSFGVELSENRWHLQRVSGVERGSDGREVTDIGAWQKSHGLRISYTFCTQFDCRLSEGDEQRWKTLTLLLPVELCTLNAFSGQRAACGMLNVECWMWQACAMIHSRLGREINANGEGCSHKCRYMHMWVESKTETFQHNWIWQFRI